MRLLVLPKTERKHLLNLKHKSTAGYQSGGPLREEIRRLRSLDLLRMRGDRTVGSMTSTMVFDLGEFVEMTALGELWAERIEKLEEAEVAGGPAEPASP